MSKSNRDQVLIEKNPWVLGNRMIFLTLNASEIEKVAHTPHMLVKVILGLGVMSLKSRMKEPCKGRLTI